MAESLSKLAEKIDLCASKDHFRLSRNLTKIRNRVASSKPIDKDLEKLAGAIEDSCARVEARRQSIPKIHLPPELPVSERSEEIKRLIDNNQVVVVAGETGSGKTTQIPKICMSLGIGARGLIGHTQPRRVAARSVASRIASELGSKLGALVGFQIRFADKSSPNTLVKLMTDGILLAEIQRDRFLNNYECIIIDEAHERSLNIDFLLGYLKNLLPKRPDLKLIITSATIDVERFSKHFNNAPVMEVSGRTYPVEIEYAPLEGEFESVTEAVVEHVRDIVSKPPQSGNAPDILAFFPGERDIRQAALALRRAQLPQLEILPLYSRLSIADQDRVFRTGRGRRIVLATNVAETSLTVPGVGYVIDTGTARISRYSVRTKIQRLPIEPISQASANQRSGRCGRIAPGHCIRLYSESDFLGRADFTAPEILRTNLASVILQMEYLRLGAIDAFPFVEPPQGKQIRDGYLLLEELSLIDKQGRITDIGRDISGIPLDPRFARMLWQGNKDGCLAEVLTVVSGMSVQDPRERPSDKQQAADERHRQFADPDSDFTAMLNLWFEYEKQRQELSNRELEKWCRRNFLSPMRLREWRDIHRQLSMSMKERGWKQNATPASAKTIHRALLSGFLTQVAVRQEDKDFLGARNREFRVFPGSYLAKKPPKWIFAAELLDTSRLFAHRVAKMDPDWLLSLAKHLLNTEYYEPYYDPRRGEVMARQRHSLYGLVIADSQKVSYKSIDPEISREIFVREALAGWKYRHKAAFFKHNKALAEQLAELEDRTRTRDIQIDDEVLYQFYAERIPPDVTDLRSFERWRKSAEIDKPRVLYLDEELLQSASQNEAIEQFPDTLEWQGITFNLVYRFEPGHPCDGVTMRVPINVLHQVPEYLTQWLVPGLLKDKLISLLKSLPKSIRKNLVPIPGYVEKMLPHLVPENTRLSEAVTAQVLRLAGLQLDQSAWSDIDMEPFYQMNFRLEDEQGSVLAESRELSKLKQDYREKADAAIEDVQESGCSVEDDAVWSFGTIPTIQEVKRGASTIRLWPGLVDKTDRVGHSLFNSPELAEYTHRRGVERLLLLESHQATKYLRKQLFKGRDLDVVSLGAGNKEVLCEDILLTVARDFVSQGEVPREEKSFRELFDAASKHIVAHAMDLERLCLELGERLRRVRSLLDGLTISENIATNDIASQLNQLIFPGFLYATEKSTHTHLARYLKGIEVRIDKLGGQVARDNGFVEIVRSYEDQYAAWHTDLAPEWREKIPELHEFRWMIEEFRISVFSQPLKTSRPISEKRLEKQISVIQHQINSLHI